MGGVAPQGLGLGGREATSSPAGPSRGPLSIGQRDANVDDLHAAFRVFTDATNHLEDEYRRLQRRAAELGEELAEKNRALRQSRARQAELEAQAVRQSRLAAMGEMAATLAHEVRNPLGAMELFVRLLMEEVADLPGPTRLADQIAGGISDLNHLVTNILDYTRLPEPNLASVRVGEVMEEAVRLASLPSEMVVDARLEIPADTFWMLDRGLVLQTLLNLLRNASEAMDGAGEIVVRASCSEAVLTIEVEDSGPGVGAEEAANIFSPFFTTKTRGTGLGLAVARAAMQAHGGNLRLRPTDAGACFCMELPDPPLGEEAPHVMSVGDIRKETRE